MFVLKSFVLQQLLNKTAISVEMFYSMQRGFGALGQG